MSEVGAAPGVLSFLRSVTRWFAAFPKPVLLVGSGLLLETAFVSGMPLLFQKLIDDAIVPRRVDVLVVLLGTLLVAALVVSAASIGRDYLYARLITRVASDLRVRLFDRLQWLSADYFKKTALADITSRFSGDLTSVEQALSTLVAWLVLPSLDIVLGTALLFFIDWRLALIAQLLWPLSLFGPQWLGPRTTDASMRLREEQARLLTTVEEASAGQAVIRVFGLREHMGAVFRRAVDAVARQGVRAHFLSSLMERSSGIGIRLMQVLVLGVGSWFAFHDTLSIGSLVAFQTLFTSVAMSLGYLSQYLPVLLHASVGLSRVESLLSDPAGIADSPGATALPSDWTTLALDHVSFVPDGRTVLDDVNLVIQRGESVALVGPSGSGKSTLLNLIMRFNEPTGGRITLDGHDYREGTYYSLARQQAAVFQDTFLFNTTVRENVRLGRPGATDAEVHAAARTGGLENVVASLAAGYDANVGERGSLLSGGQRQRVAIARALLRDPRVLLLDEATSALDPRMETEINATLKLVRRGRTVITVCHRLASISDYDRIVVMEAGRIVEEGRHDDLLALDGAYADLWQKQSGLTLNAEGDRAVVDAERLKDIPILADLDYPQRQLLASRFVTERVPEGRVVVQQGDVGDRFYIVVRGKVVVVANDREIAMLSVGDHFGEIALLRDTPRTATVRTLAPSVFVTLDRAEFMGMLAASPELLARVDGQARSRIEQLTAQDTNGAVYNGRGTPTTQGTNDAGHQGRG